MYDSIYAKVYGNHSDRKYISSCFGFGRDVEGQSGVDGVSGLQKNLGGDGYVNKSQLIKVYSLNMCDLLHVNCNSVKSKKTTHVPTEIMIAWKAQMLAL